MVEEKITLKPPRAFLELARSSWDAFHGLPRGTMTPDTMLALIALHYVPSFMAIESFINERLYQEWQRDKSQLRQEYSGCTTFKELVKTLLERSRVKV